MKSSILLLIAMMVIFAGCGQQEKHKDVSGSCEYTEYGIGAVWSKCYITTDEAACSEHARGANYIYTIGGSCSNRPNTDYQARLATSNTN